MPGSEPFAVTEVHPAEDRLNGRRLPRLIASITAPSRTTAAPVGPQLSDSAQQPDCNSRSDMRAVFLFGESAPVQTGQRLDSSLAGPGGTGHEQTIVSCSLDGAENRPCPILPAIAAPQATG
jgi:hypothetical protein